MNGRTRLALFAGLATLLATVSLGAVFQDASWFLPCLGAVLTVAATGEAARRSSLPRLVVPLVQLAGLAILFTLIYARTDAVLGFLPGPGAIEDLRAVAERGFTDIARFAAPVRTYEGIVALAVGGVGLVAWLVDTLAVTLRRAALAGLPLLAMHAVPVAVLADGVGWAPFAVGGAGYLALLLADSRERVSRWGRPIGRSLSDRAAARGYRGEIETAPLGQVGRRVGAAALGLAIVVPPLLPGLDEGVLGGTGSGFGLGGSGGTITVINPIVDLQRDLTRPENREIIRVRTDSANPGYLRMVTLDTFNGTSWIPAELRARGEQDVDEGLPPPIGLGAGVARQTVRSQISVGELMDPRLPLPYPAIAIEVEGDWRYDTLTRNVFSYRNDTRGLQYAVNSLEVDPEVEQLRNAPSAPPEFIAAYTQLPEQLPLRLREELKRITEDLASDYDKALAIQQWLRTFAYDLSVRSGNGTDALASFLQDRRGYCEQFAATMAIMARLEGIPARVNVGFATGRRLPDGTWSVTLHDAHAWPELYFSGVGWVPFEPTPRADGLTPPPVYASADLEPLSLEDEEANAGGGGGRNQNFGGSTTGQGSGLSAVQLERLAASVDPSVAAPELGAEEEQAATGTPRVLVFVALGALALLFVPAIARLAIRRRRWARSSDPRRHAQAAWAEVRDVARDLGYAWDPAMTPRRTGLDLAQRARLSAGGEESLHRVIRAVERARYAREPGEMHDLRADVERVHRGLADARSKRVRWQAQLLPASTADVGHQLGERIADGLDWVDRCTAGLRARAGRLAGGSRSATG